MWREAATSTGIGISPFNHVYVHVPFCRSICSFCNYQRHVLKDQGQLRSWLEQVQQSISTLSPSVRSMTWHTLYVGGGSPSILPAELLDELLGTLEDSFQWHPDGNRHFEFEPALMDSRKLSVLLNHRFSNFSFGIQTLDSEVNKRHNRGHQTEQLIARRFREFGAAGVDRISCDILLGLAGSTPEGILAEIEALLERYSPHRIDIFALAPTRNYLVTHFDGSPRAFQRHLAPFLKRVPPGLESLVKRFDYRYSEGMGHHMSLQRTRPPREPANGHAGSICYTQLASQQGRPINLLGFGPSARSHIFARASFRYEEPSRTRKAAAYVGNLEDTRSELVTLLVHVLRDRDSLSRDLLVDIFGTDLEDLIPVALGGWQAEDGVEVTDRELRLPPQSVTERARTLLWLVEDHHLEHELAAVCGLSLKRADLEALAAPLKEGVEIIEGATLRGVLDDRYRIRLTDSDDEFEIRIAPPLEEGKPLRLLLLSPPPTGVSQQQVLTAVIRELTRLIHGNWERSDGHRP